MPLTDELRAAYYRSVPAEDLAGRGEEDLVGAIDSHADLARHRSRGTAVVRVHAPEPDHDGWSCGSTVVEVVTDDMPFLVDSVTAALTGLGCRLHLVIHPVLSVRRTVEGILAAADSADASEDLRESWIHVECDPGTVTADEVEEALRRVLSDVREAVEDWPKMLATVAGIARDLRQSAPPGIPSDEAQEAAALLDWLADDNFTFLGFREYRLTDDDRLAAVPGTGLGILRSDSDARRGGRALSGRVAAHARVPRVLVLTSANSRSTIHRPAYLDYVGVKMFDDTGNVIGERRFLGLYAATAYSDSVREIPVLRDRARQVLDLLEFEPRSHSGKEVIQFLETYPREDLFQVDVEELAAVALAVHQMSERRLTRLFVRRDPYERFASCLVYLPRDRYTTAVRLRVQHILAEAFGGSAADHSARVSESVLARLHVVVRANSGGSLAEPDLEEVQKRIAATVRSWADDFEEGLAEAVGQDRARMLMAKYEPGVPESYRQEVPVDAAVRDILLAESLRDDTSLELHLYAPRGRDLPLRRLKLIRRGNAISLARVLPLLSSFGATVEDEHPYDIDLGDETLRIYDLGFVLPAVIPEHVAGLRARFEEAFVAAWFGNCEADALNELVVVSGLSWRQVVILRAYVRYLLQSGSSLGLDYVESALLRNPHLARMLVELFEARFDPALEEGRRDRQEAIAARMRRDLDEVASLDEDRTLRSLFAMVSATLRTNAYQRTPQGEHLDRLSIKLDAQSITDLPLPRPRYEIWVYSPRVEGVHLRFGQIARGGLRWSDRRADFRTEVLGLVKAQEVKNAVIVPAGAKGGFLPKSLPDPLADREAWFAEGQAAYATFVRGLLDITDNRREGGIVPPRDVVRYDGDDPYLVVAADKGTATFSDLANSVAAEYDFWLGDAFASGGSAGYDHKAMGITARGAWVSVRQHLRELDIDPQEQDFTVVGVGDMSGDVFGNGMLLSEHICLVAAFDHRHIFLDPRPDAPTSFLERKRLFDLPRSSWADYQADLISAGGGIFDRTAKSVPISPEVAASLGIPPDVDALPPAELIKCILTAPVDLLWNGGIGTYVKALAESNADVGDKANDAVRVNGSALRCRAVGEGGNLGLTQLGRVEAAQAGVRLNTDAIDNSAGVDTSDHEVNIKILLDGAVRDGELDEKARDELLASMTDEVAALVLRDNVEQNILLGTARWGASALSSVHGRMITDLESRGLLDRTVEYLPDDEELAARATRYEGLTSPELAVLAAYAKNSLVRDLEDAGLASDPWFSGSASTYFPSVLREEFAVRIASHPLRDQIVVTSVVNYLINRGGISVVFRACEETGASPPEAVRAAYAAIAAFDLPAYWDALDALEGRCSSEALNEVRYESRRLLDRATRWFLQTRGGSIDVAGETQRFKSWIERLSPSVEGALVGIERQRRHDMARRFRSLGAPDAAADRAAGMMDDFALLDVVQVAEGAGQSPAEVMPLYFALSERYDVDRLLVRITGLPRGDRWSALARQALRTDLYAALAGVTQSVIMATQPSASPEQRIEAWESLHREGLGRARATLDQIAAHETGDLATLSVALRVLRNLVAQGQ